MKAYLEVRSQKSKGSGLGRFGGPDTYVAVQIVPDGVPKLTSLMSASARKRGIEIRYFGEGYHNHSGPRSRLGRALAEAKAFVAAYNKEPLKYVVEVINRDGSAADTEVKEFASQDKAEEYARSWAKEYDKRGRWYLYGPDGNQLASEES